MSEFAAVLSDLTAMARAFQNESVAYGGLRSDLNPPAAATGSADLDTIVSTLLLEVSGLHEAMTDRLAEHGTKLAYVRDSYRRTDVDAHGAFEDLVD